MDGLDLAAAPEDAAATADCVVIVTDHSSFDYRDWWNAPLSLWIRGMR